REGTADKISFGGDGDSDRHPSRSGPALTIALFLPTAGRVAARCGWLAAGPMRGPVRRGERADPLGSQTHYACGLTPRAAPFRPPFPRGGSIARSDGYARRAQSAYREAPGIPD